MIGDDDDDDDNDGDDVSLACQEHANGFGNCAHLQFCKLSITRELLCCVAANIWRRLACLPRKTKNKTFRNFQKHVGVPRGDIQRHSHKHTISRKMMVMMISFISMYKHAKGYGESALLKNKRFPLKHIVSIKL